MLTNRRSALEAATGAVIETLENRRLLTTAGDAALATEWELAGRDGEYRGTATLVDGILHVVTTAGGESIEIGTHVNSGIIYVRATDSSVISDDNTRVRGVNVERARVRGIQVDAGDGNDGVAFLNFNGMVNLPVTMNGGAGDDELYGEDDRNNVDDPIAFREYQSSYAKVVLNGGDGNDRLQAGIGDTTLIGGAGDDQISTGDRWGHNTVIDDPGPPVEPVTPASPVEPAEAQERAAQPATTHDGASPSAANPTAVPPPFSTAAAPLALVAVFGDHADDVWDA
jgi:hypothetical protein